VDPKKIESMQDWPCPKTLKIFHGFLGLTRYYMKFVLNYEKSTTPLSFFLKKNAFTWTSVTDHAFQAWKDAMCMTLILSLPYFTNTFILECDASRKGIGVILMQYGRPLAFTSKQILEQHLG
jgi:hypothetical protein